MPRVPAPVTPALPLLTHVGVMSIDSVLAFLVDHAYLVVFLGTLIDATGTPFPGRLLLITAGGLAATSDLNPVPLIGLAIAGAVLGDHLWYLAGKLAGGRLIAWYCRIFTRGTQGCAERARGYLERFGPVAVIVGRFMGAVRILVIPLAAENGMPYRRYVTYDVIGATLWCSLWVLVGLFLGDQWMIVRGERRTEAFLAMVVTGMAITLVLVAGAHAIDRFRASRPPQPR